MTPLLVLTAVLLVLSGIVKLRAADRAGLGLPLLPVLESVGGVVVAGGALFLALTPSQGLAVVLVSLALILVSSAHMWSGLKGLQRRRELSEGARLRTYVDYNSATLDPDGAFLDPEDQEPQP